MRRTGSRGSPKRLTGLCEPLALTLRVARLATSELFAKGLVLSSEIRDHSLLITRDPADGQEDEVLDDVFHTSE